MAGNGGAVSNGEAAVEGRMTAPDVHEVGTSIHAEIKISHHVLALRRPAHRRVRSESLLTSSRSRMEKNKNKWRSALPLYLPSSPSCPTPHAPAHTAPSTGTD